MIILSEFHQDGVRRAMSYDTKFCALPNALEEVVAARTARVFADSSLRWARGRVVKVGFLGGSTDLHAAVADAADQINRVCGRLLDFGYDPASGAYRRWSERDERYRAHVRVGFGGDGYWTLGGRGHVTASLTAPGERIGGAPHQRSLSLGGFDVCLPQGWRRIVLRQFMRALGFETTKPMGGHAVRWSDDPGYEHTIDGVGRLVPDRHGHRPGFERWLRGAPNNWDGDRIARVRSGGYAVPRITIADVNSVLRYRLDPAFVVAARDGEMPTTDGNQLASGDEDALRRAYSLNPRIDGPLRHR